MMTLNEIKNSGLLESYVLGDISPDDRRMVDEAIKKYPELNEYIREIENALQLYATVHAVQPTDQLREEILSQARNSKPPLTDSKKSKPNKNTYKYLWWIGWIALLGALLWKNNQLISLQTQLDELKIVCDSLQSEQDQQIRIFNDIREANNQIFAVQATEKFPGTDLYLHVNATTGTNYLQIKNLPSIAADQSYQLWSLKGDEAIPLDVFQGDGSNIFNVRYEPGTDAYAITIEPRGGQQTPTLDNLIGVIPLS